MDQCNVLLFASKFEVDSRRFGSLTAPLIFCYSWRVEIGFFVQH